MLSGVNGASPWAASASESASYLVEAALGGYSSGLIQILDDPVPQMGGALDEQVIAVPKISLAGSQNAVRIVVRGEWWHGWVEVPTIISYSSPQQRTSEQIIDISVPQGRVGRGGHGGLQGVSQGQGSTALGGADPVDIPVPRSGGLQGFLPRQGSTTSSSSSHVRARAADEPFRVFSHFSPDEKKCAVVSALGVRNWVRTFTPWTPAAYAESMAGADDESEAESEAEAEVEEGAADSLCSWLSGLCGSARGSSSTSWDGQCGECAYGDRCTFAHSWAELHPEASAHEQQLASYFPD